MRRPSNVHLAIALTAAIGAVALSRLAWVGREQPVDLRISTGTEGGTYITLGGQLARILDEFGSGTIGRVEATESGGSVENALRLARGETDLTFVVEPVLASVEPREQVRALLALYTNVAQILVRKDAGIASLADLRGKRVFSGAEGSGTQWLADRIFAAVGLVDSDFRQVPFAEFGQVEAALRTGNLDAALLITATPVRAVVGALTDGCCALIGLDAELERIVAGVPGLIVQEIPARTYPAQPESVRTVGSTVLLAARAEIPDPVVMEVLDAFFHHLRALGAASTRVQDIRIERGFEDLSGAVPLHPGAAEFRDRELETLLIATGSLSGRYYTLGKRMEEVLGRHRIPARVLHTDGSLENLEILGGDRPALAIVQYDAALASHWSPTLSPRRRNDESAHVPTTEGLRRIATLHQESVHVLVRRDRLPEDAPEKPTLALLENLRVSLGPSRSGTRVIAEQLILAHAVRPSEMLQLSVPDSLARLNSGEIDAGFFVSYVPNQALRSAVNDERNRLLSIDPRRVGDLLSPAMTVSRIEPGTYGSQLPSESAVDTVSTWAVLTTTADLPFDVQRIARAVFEGAGFIGVDLAPEQMSLDLSSLPLHPGARAYYEEAGLKPSDSRDWLKILGQLLGILVILAGAYGGILRLRRETTSNAIGRRILEIPIGADDVGSVGRLMAIRNVEIPDRVRRMWWRFGELDQARWRYLDELVKDRISDARENLTLRLAQEIRSAASIDDMDANARRTYLRSMRADIWEYFHSGELEASQEALLLELIELSVELDEQE